MRKKAMVPTESATKVLAEQDMAVNIWIDDTLWPFPISKSRKM
jgi:hypothetical protein